MSSESNVTPALQALSGEAAGRMFPIDRDVVVLGRHIDCDIVLDNGAVSRRHAQVLRRPDGLYLEDLDSHNGTRLEGVKLKPFTPLPLSDGQRIQICDIFFICQSSVVTITPGTEDSSKILGMVDLTETTHGHFLVVKPEEKLRALMEIGRALGSTIQFQEVLERTLTALFEIFPHAERGFVLLQGRDSGTLMPEALKLRRGTEANVSISRTIFQHVLTEGKAILSEDLGADSRFLGVASVSDSQIRTLMCVPLLGHDRQPMGILQLDTADRTARFSPEDLDLLAIVAGQINVALANTRLHQEAVRQQMIEQGHRDAKEVQRIFLPESRPEVPGYLFWDVYEPAHHVGGDYFDYLPVRDPESSPDAPPSRWALAMGDVSGKGMPAALLMVKVSCELRLFLLADTDPIRVVERLNRQLHDVGLLDRFVTFLLVVVDVESHRLTVISAGHMGPLIRRVSGTIEVIGEQESGVPLSLDRDHRYQAVTTSIERGDVVVLYTDGVTEAMNTAGNHFGFHRLTRVVAAAPPRVPSVGESILKAVRQHYTGCLPADDLTLLCFGRC